MLKVLIYSGLLIAGLVLSQFLPSFTGDLQPTVAKGISLATMVCLSFIMIHVGNEFDIDKKNLRQYGWDYVVAATAAAFPWIFCALYFVFVLLPAGSGSDIHAWKESLLASRFAAPTSAGVLFSMLAAAGLAATWVFRKARILAIFDDLDTVLLMIPLKMMMVGAKWQLGVIVAIMAVQLGFAWSLLHKLALPMTWKWVMAYSVIIVAISESIYVGSKAIDATVPIHIEVLLPAFVLGCIIRQPSHHGSGGHDGHHALPPSEERASTTISALFMVLVGLSMPAVLGTAAGKAPAEAPTKIAGYLAANTPEMSWGVIIMHTLILTVISNIGKMFPAFCYRKEASLRERLAVSIGMWPRGEVGAGVLVLSLSYGIGGPIVTIAMMSLALNLVLTGVFILWIKKLIAPVYALGGSRASA